MIPFAGAVLSNVSGHVLTCTCLTCTCLNCTWREAVNCSVWIDFHIYMSGLGLISSSLKVIEMHTWSSDWKPVVIIVFGRRMREGGRAMHSPGTFHRPAFHCLSNRGVDDTVPSMWSPQPPSTGIRRAVSFPPRAKRKRAKKVHEKIGNAKRSSKKVCLYNKGVTAVLWNAR
jgi:hypothetical protein